MSNNGIIFIDLDGVILDTEKIILNKKEENNNLSWDEFFECLNWEMVLSNASQINDSIEILKKAQKFRNDLIILTKCHTLKEMQEKVKALRYNREITIPIMFVPPHVKKSEIYLPMNREILIDDSQKNIVNWEAVGGIGLLFDNGNNQKYKRKIRSLEFLLK